MSGQCLIQMTVQTASDGKDDRYFVSTDSNQEYLALAITLQWRHNERDVESPASRLFTQPFVQAQIKENIKAPCHWLCEGNSPVSDEFHAQRASNAESVSIWLRHH